MILTIRTDKPEAEVGLYDGETRLGYEKWLAHRELGVTLHMKISRLLQASGTSWSGIKGIIYYKGPGSFTGLRIGASVASALAYANDVPVVSVNGDDWIKAGLKKMDKSDDRIALPEYGAEPHITAPRK
jgi:tRNA threonylcarbamoyladenosine biosynthesis protein TsaB